MDFGRDLLGYLSFLFSIHENKCASMMILIWDAIEALVKFSSSCSFSHCRKQASLNNYLSEGCERSSQKGLVLTVPSVHFALMQNEPKNQEGLKGIAALQHRLPLSLHAFILLRKTHLRSGLHYSGKSFEKNKSRSRIEGQFLNLTKLAPPSITKIPSGYYSSRKLIIVLSLQGLVGP
ncbi:MAG: hypothetical protein R2776_07125 [Flavobacteriaceae bacterium]|nr:hypothetical protein [Flavobacteriaceae bacterium]